MMAWVLSVRSGPWTWVSNETFTSLAAAGQHLIDHEAQILKEARRGIA